MSQLKAMAGSVSERGSLSSPGRECRPPSSSRYSGITCPQPVVAMARISSSSHVLFDIPSQFPLFTDDPINYDTVISLPSPLGVLAAPTSSLSSSFATNSRTTSRAMVIRRNYSDKSHSPQPTPDDGNSDGAGHNNNNNDNDAASPVSSATSATVSVMVTITSESTYDTMVTLGSTSPGSTQPSPTGTVASAPSTVTLGSTSSRSVQPLSPGNVASTPSTMILGSTSPGSVQPSPTGTVASAPSTVTLGSTSPGSVQPWPTGTVTSAPSTSKPRSLPLILGLVFGVIFLVALAVVIYEFRSRRRQQAELLPQPLPGHGNQNYQEQSLRDPTPPATPATLERRPRAPPLVGRVSEWRSRCRSQDSSEPTSEVLSDPFADGSIAVSSRTSEPAANNHFAVFGERLSVLHTSDNSELNILAPIPPNAGTSIHSSYFSPTGHYRERHAPLATSAEDTMERSSLVFTPAVIV
ncbi:uncharacterized protein BJ212DRAFT_1483830 [Suillus subaureus]|uniref:Uncharacterized protein n=1 Tax=Suillus subaureus TaxID=48587 RepID=A0A9P7E5B0_9AGAM|nr:uncharacterized protein BJ212DRAFT_1483830 [Suillus subaureus]KAG1811167.1 hypothetical protein BJ212DRAFT_1483830 [Suillus subaureus]